MEARLRSQRLLDTRVICCGDCLEQLRKLPDAGVDLIYTQLIVASLKGQEPSGSAFHKRL